MAKQTKMVIDKDFRIGEVDKRIYFGEAVYADTVHFIVQGQYSRTPALLYFSRVKCLAGLLLQSFLPILCSYSSLLINRIKYANTHIIVNQMREKISGICSCCVNIVQTGQKKQKRE